MEILVTAIPGTNLYQYSFLTKLIKIYETISFRFCEICDFEVDNLEDILFLEAYSLSLFSSLVVNDLRSETKGSRFESGC